MSNLVIIDIDQLSRAIETAIRQANKNDVWITQNQACKLVSRRKLEKAMAEDRVRWKKTGDERYSRVLVVKKDVEKLLNNQL